MTLLPIFLRLEGRPVLVVGAGSVALGKIGSLLDAGASITVVAPAAVEEVQEPARSGALRCAQKRARRLKGNFGVVARDGIEPPTAGLFRAAGMTVALRARSERGPDYFGS